MLDRFFAPENKLPADSKPVVTITPAANYGGDFMARIKEESQKRVAQAELDKKDSIALDINPTHHVLETIEGIKSVPILPNPDIKSMEDFLKHSVSTRPAEAKNLDFKPEVQIAAEIENTFKKGMKTPESVEQILYSPTIFTEYRLSKLKKEGGDVAEIAKIIQTERNLLASEMNTNKDVVEMNKRIETIADNVERSKAKIRELNSEIENANEAGDFTSISELTDKLKLETRTGSHSQLEIQDVQNKISKFKKSSSESIERRRFSIAETKSNLEARGINFDKVIKALAGVQEIKNTTEQTFHDLTPEQKVVISKATGENTSESAQAPEIVKKIGVKDVFLGLLSKSKKAIESLTSRLKTFIFNNTTSDRKVTEDFLKTGAIAATLATASIVGATAYHENLKQPEEKKSISIEAPAENKVRNISDDMILPNGGTATFQSRASKIAENLNVENTEKVTIENFDNTINTEEVKKPTETVKYFDTDKYMSKGGEGMISVYKTLNRELIANGYTNVDAQIKSIVQKKLEAENKKLTPENIRLEIDSLLTSVGVQINEQTKEFKQIEYRMPNGKIGYNLIIPKGYTFDKLTTMGNLLSYLDILEPPSKSIDINPTFEIIGNDETVIA